MKNYSIETNIIISKSIPQKKEELYSFPIKFDVSIENESFQELLNKYQNSAKASILSELLVYFDKESFLLTEE